MSLYIRDPSVNELATRLQKATGARSKTEAVRRALEAEMQRLEQARPLQERIAKSLAMADAIGRGRGKEGSGGKGSGGDFDMKAFMDEMWEI